MEVLVVASKIKKYIKDKAGMNCSSSVMEALTQLIQEHCDRAIANAESSKRKTVMDRDFQE